MPEAGRPPPEAYSGLLHANTDEYRESRFPASLDLVKGNMKHEAEDPALVSTLFDRLWWGKAIGVETAGLVGSDSGGLLRAALRGRDLGYAEKPDSAPSPG
jgi:hypothetical protein